jgi:four helix bundle protein
MAIGSDPSHLRDFTDLEVWKAARDLRCEVYRLVRALPDFEKFALATQLRRAAVSVTANIAEGFARYSYQENVQFCRQTRGSVYEVRDHLITCRDEHHLAENDFVRIDELAQRMAKLLNGYLRSTLARRQLNAHTPTATGT